uniref:Monodehydroascorbate reductase n=1 Tax=Tanacetum cinerariifolium TaxID=118510 RepID=A0A6L2J425_TANCI|nr:hypothetical protein [Tanacetum cinerariifolium]
MVDMSAPSGQAPAMAPPIRTDDEILPHNKWVQIGKSNCYLNLDKKQSNLIFKMVVDLLMHTNFHRAFTASTTVPSIYIQQFWDTIQYDKKAGIYRCQLDEQWFVLTKDTLREALQITPLNNTQAFVAPPSAEVLVDLVNRLGYPRMVKNVSNVVTNDMFQPWRALTTIINLCLTGKTSGFERPRAPVLQILWGIITQSNIDYAERIWEEFTQSIHTFMKDNRNLSRHTTGKKRATLILIPRIRFTKLIIHHLQRGTGSTQDLPAPKLAKPARKPSISIPVTSTQPAPTSDPVKSQEYKRKQATEITDKPLKPKEAEEVPAEEPQVTDEDADYQKAVEESIKVAYALPKGPLPPVVIREPKSRKYQPLPEVPGKGKAKVTNEEESEKVALGAEKGGQDEGQAGPGPDAQAEDQMGSDAGAQAEGQAGSNPDETTKSLIRHELSTYKHEISISIISNTK